MALHFQRHNQFDSALEQSWNALLERSLTNTPFLRFGYLHQWWQTRGGGEWPASASLQIITAHDGSKLTGIAPFFLTIHEGAPTIMLLGSTEISDFLDILCEPECLVEFISGLLDFYLSDTETGWQKLLLDNIPDSSATLEALRQGAAAQQLCFSSEELHPAPYIPLPGDWEAYLAGIEKKQRHEIRRKMRRAEENAPNLKWHVTQNEDQLQADSETFLQLMAFDAEKKRFLTPAMRAQMLSSMRWALDENMLFLAFLDIDQQPAAAYYCFDYGNALWVYNSGFNPVFMEYSPGWVLLGYLLRWANENRRAVFDFMRGGEEYKYRFGAIKRSVMRVILHRNI